MLDDLTGKIVKSYELKELIGVGGFGAVYRAHQQLIEREVAVKVILPQHANRPDFIRRFETEAQLIARLEHPHIVPLYDYWREASGAYLVMRWLRGGSTQDYIEQNGPWKPEQARPIFSQIVEALAVAHRQGVIHRDLKPENIMLDENGNAYLTDFGIAKDLAGTGGITQANAIVGSPAYLAPEQIQGETVTVQSDIYSLGVVLFELLTGQRPFTDNNPATLMYHHLSDPLPDIMSIDPNLSPAINEVIQRATYKDPALRYADVIEMVHDLRNALKVDEAGGTNYTTMTASRTVAVSSSSLILPEPENPYKGLRAFQRADAADFFGRNVLIKDIIDRLRGDEPESNFLAVVGPSGSGKSSVVKAGVIPALRENAIEGSKDWFVIEMMPSIDPMEELEVALLRIAVNPPESLITQLNEDERGLIRAVKRVLPTDDAELLLVIDQFEELFTLVDEEEARAHFLNSLLTAIKDPRTPIRVIVTLRADFYGRPLQYNAFGELMRARTEIVLPLNSEELERAISGPAERVGMHLEPALLSTIVADVSEQPGALPLLQYALTELFERRDGHTLTLEAYNDIGGTMGALARRAEELYESIGDDGQEAARQIFLRLVTLGEGAEDTRRRVLQTDLLSIGDDRDTISMVVDAFGRYRLLTFDHDPGTRSATVEVAHEALIRQWARLRGWLAENRENLRMQRRVNAAAKEWLNANRESSFLARGSRLTQLESWYNSTDLTLNTVETEYLDASIQQRRHLQAEEEARQKREEELERRSRNRLRALVGVMAVAAIVATVLAVFGFTESQEAARNEAAAEEARTVAELSAAEAQSLALAANARNTLIQHNPTLALALALQANTLLESTPIEVLRVLANAAYSPGVRHRYPTESGSITGTAISGDGNLSIAGSVNGVVTLWDNTNGQQIADLSLEGVITDIHFNPEATQFALAIDERIHVFDRATMEEINLLEGHEDIVTSLDWNENGLLSGSFDKTMILWDLTSGEVQERFEGHVGLILDVDLSTDGRRAVSSTADATSADTRDDDEDRKVRIFDTATGDLLRTIDPQNGYARAVAISHDGSRIASGTWSSSTRGLIELWDTETGESQLRLFGHINLITDVAFAPDDTVLYSTSADQSLRLWDLNTGVEVDRFEVFNDNPLSLSLSETGDFLLTGTGNIGINLIDDVVEQSVDASPWLIDLVNRAQIDVYTGHEDWVWSVDVSPDGRFAASGSGVLTPPAENLDTSVRIWDIGTGDELNRLEGHLSTVEGVAYSPDGETIVSGAWDGRVILWDAATGERIRTFVDPDIDHAPVSAYEEGELIEFEIDDAAMTGRVLAVVFNTDGSIAASSSNDGYVTIWDVESGEKIRTLAEHDGAIAGLRFSDDGQQIVTGSWDNTAALWDVESGEKLQTFTGHSNQINDVDISSDGSRILTASWDNTVRLWDTDSGREIRRFLGHNGQIQTVTFSEDDTMALSGGADTTVRLWDIESGQEIFQLDEHMDWVSQVQFLPGEQFAISSGQDKTVRLWQIPTSFTDIADWVAENRYVPELTCSERERYRIEPLCEGEVPDEL